MEDILLPAISALSTLTLLLVLASAAIVLVHTWNSFCVEGRGGDGGDYLDDDDRRALTQISLRYISSGKKFLMTIEQQEGNGPLDLRRQGQLI